MPSRRFCFASLHLLKMLLGTPLPLQQELELDGRGCWTDTERLEL